MRRQLGPALRMLALATFVLGLAYPLAVTGAAQVLFPSKANGSLVRNASGRVVGSRLLGQSFTGPASFHPRPSAAGSGYDAAQSGGSSLGPSSPKLAALVRRRVVSYRAENHLSVGTLVPVDAVTASGSGLDPDISVANADLQAPRVAAARGLPLATVRRVVDAHVDHESLGFLGGTGVNVLELNLALDRLG